jgi:hypothetical protein
MKVGVTLGWMGFPAIAPDELCFSQGSVSAFLEGESAYHLDGVAVSGVSGGPAFSTGPQLAGIVSAYLPNRQPGGMFPGLLKAMNVAHLHATRIKSVDAARAEAQLTAAAAAASPPHAAHVAVARHAVSQCDAPPAAECAGAYTSSSSAPEPPRDRKGT